MSSTPSPSPFTLPMATLVGLTIDRFVALAKPPGVEPSPFCHGGGTAAEWARAAAVGLELEPHETIAKAFPGAIDPGGHDPANIATAALQRLAQRAIVERVGGLPIRYRPLVR